MNGVKNTATRGKVLTKVELAYIAGLLDGEGCINIGKITTDYIREVEKRKVPKYVLSVTVYNTHQETVQWLHELFGGYLQTRYRHPKTWRTNYAWKVSANTANDFLKQVVKLLRIKKRQAQRAIEFQDNQSRFHRAKKGKPAGMSVEDLTFRENCYQELKALNKGTLPAETK